MSNRVIGKMIHRYSRPFSSTRSHYVPQKPHRSKLRVPQRQSPSKTLNTTKPISLGPSLR
eukprot:scaffold253524_cov28-Prasinocladus_malaysianus.AAC.1